jgi:hypothetical protein
MLTRKTWHSRIWFLLSAAGTNNETWTWLLATNSNKQKCLACLDEMQADRLNAINENATLQQNLGIT